MASAHISISRINLSLRSISPRLSSKRRYTTVARVTQNQSYWESIQSDIDSHLKKAIPIPIHLMHADMYVHENMLLSDRVEPQPAIPHKSGPKIELMTGDGIMPFGFELLAGSMDPASNNADKILRVIIEISRAISRGND
ncbi:heterodimeric geranylgeranyl pyrophosphate synthase small subunit, chloroplastic-like protein [Tanacetum coccineum]|uniref:Heterodimeric geranylgeranyl pyrophosphate synthase small subunit, chloroplastic-like protein n=1 Tax=Tanacetum coccineum TaxID=301880 RepID=A0ABQ5BCR0_9ASTR